MLELLIYMLKSLTYMLKLLTHMLYLLTYMLELLICTLKLLTLMQKNKSRTLDLLICMRDLLIRMWICISYIGFYALVGRVNSNLLICLYWGEVVPNRDLTYFFTLRAVSTKPVSTA